MKPTPENIVKRQIKDYLWYTGWFVRHHFQGIGCYKGMPDMSATRHGITIEIECKSPTGEQNIYQENYERNLTHHGGLYVLARSVDDVIKVIEGGA